MIEGGRATFFVEGDMAKAIEYVLGPGDGALGAVNLFPEYLAKRFNITLAEAAFVATLWELSP